ncbi:M14 family metallopeptidase [Knoellia sinensis]|nr:M14 family metallopeptidase [Knoellia sinensis]
MLAVPTLVAGLLLGAGPASSAPPGDRLDVYEGTLSTGQIDELVALGVDRHDLRLNRVQGASGAKAEVRVEAILSDAQARGLARKGVEMKPKKVKGQTASERATAAAAEGYEVFNTYLGTTGIKAEYEQAARANPTIAKAMSIGKTTNGTDIIALKVSKNAARQKDGLKPAVLYMGAQHAREWITPEMNRRLMHHVLDNYGSDSRITRLVDSTELWFVPVANPDGYDFTFTEGNRLWRKNLRDNNGDGTIAPGDGVDLNRNYATKWGYDNEGSSPAPGSETYRGPSPNSEPESKALDGLVGRVGFEFMVNYHSAAELLLYGTGWQVSTPTPDDVIYEAMAGDDAEPAVPGYDPDISAELYTTNGDTDTHMTERHGTLGFTPEMSTCEAASDSVPDDEWLAEDCASGFNFPDDEGLVQTEFLKNIPFALSVAASAHDPDDPASVVGRDAAPFVMDTFEVSHGASQEVAVTAKRSLRNRNFHYRVNGGPARTAAAPEWAGGERYGDENDDYYAEFRGTVPGARAGDRVEAWFTGVETAQGNGTAGRVESEHMTYTVEDSTPGDVLVIADEDYKGVNPTYPAGTNAPKYAAQHVAALEAAGYDADVWDIDAQGVPHHLGVLGHYDAVLWYLGDNRLTQDAEDERINTPFGPLPDIAVAERAQYLTLAVRDYLNEGGKLIHSGETAQYSGLPGIGDAVGGLFYGLNGDPEAECVISSLPGFFEDCLILADDFRQYYLGAFTRTSTADAGGVSGTAEPLDGYEGTFGGPVVTGANPLDEAGVFQPTSDVLPVADFPQFASRGALEYAAAGVDPFAPVEGTRYAGAVHADSSYMRLSKTVDLSAASAAQLRFQISINTEPSYDNVIVEARSAGQDNWTTLPDLNGGTQTDPPAECEPDGFLLGMHPFLAHYLAGPGCTQPGSSGTWNSFTGSTDGWHQAAFDLSGFLGDSVELSISYVTDPATGGIGAFVDDTHVVVDGVDSADGFEGATSTWTVGGPPEGSAPNQGNWVFSERLIQSFAATSTADSVLLGFGLEQLSTDAQRSTLLRQALGGLLTDQR